MVRVANRPFVGRSPVNQPKSTEKPFAIPKQAVVEAFKKVKENQGGPGVDGCTIEEFESELRDRLYVTWNRMSSGSYIPPPVKVVKIPKPHGGGMRMLGVPTVIAYHKVAQAVFRFAGRHPSVSSAVRRAVGGAVRSSYRHGSYLRVRGRAAGERVAAGGCDGSWPGAG